MKSFYAPLLSLAVFFTCTYSNCTHGTSEYAVAFREPVNADLAGKMKTIGIDVTAPEGYHTTSILLNHWFAGFNPGPPAQTFPVDHHGNFSFTADVPESDHLETCEGMYFMVTIQYTAPNGQNGVFIGEPKLIMPTKHVSGNTIEEALCAEPPGPGE